MKPDHDAAGRQGRSQTVYVKTVRAEDLPPQIEVPQGLKVIYAIHGENGEPMALVGDRSMAFAVARKNNYTPVSVH